jgi:hypothetical protein
MHRPTYIATSCTHEHFRVKKEEVELKKKEKSFDFA